MRAVRGLILKYRPDLYVDVHVTDGMDYQYDVTFGFNGEDGAFSRSPHGSQWLDSVFKPAMNAALERQGHIPGELVFGVDDDEPKKGLSDGGLGERYSNGWGAAAHVPTILIENHSLKPHEQRVLGTYVFIEEALRLLADKGSALRAATEQDRALRPAEILANFEQEDTPASTRPFKGVLFDTYFSPASGRNEIRWSGQPDPDLWQMPFYGSKPTLTLRRPTAYWIPSYRTDIIERLKAHGVQMETVAAPRVVNVEMLRLVSPKLAARANEGHVQASVGDGEDRASRLDLPHRIGAGPDRPAAGRRRHPAAGAAVERELLRLGHVPRGHEPGRIYRGLRHRAAGRDDAGGRSGAEGRVRGETGGRARLRRRSAGASGLVL